MFWLDGSIALHSRHVVNRTGLREGTPDFERACPTINRGSPSKSRRGSRGVGPAADTLLRTQLTKRRAGFQDL